MANDKSAFLVEEYKQLHESLYKSNEAIVTAIRFTVTLFAAFSGAILVAYVREGGIDRKTVLIAVAAVSLFFFIVCLLGSFFLLNTFKGVRRMFTAINAIRTYYVSLDNIPKEYVIMPLKDSQQPHRLFAGWPAIFLSHIFSAFFLLVGSFTLYIFLDFVRDYLRILILAFCFLFTIIFSCIHGWLIERGLSNTITTKKTEDN